MDDQIERYEHDLKTEYKDIDKLHRKHFIGVRVNIPWALFFVLFC